MITFSVIVMLAAAGVAPALILDRRQPALAVAGLGFLYGSGLLYVVLLAQALTGIRWSVVTTVAALLVVSGASLARLRRGTRGLPPSVPWSWIDGGTVVLVAGYALYVAASGPHEGDFWMIWGLKGRVFFDAGGIDWRWLENVWHRYAHPDYPLLVPFNYAFVAMVAGEWSDRWIGLFSLAYGSALLLVVRAAAASQCGRHAAAAIALGVAGFALSPQVGMAEAALIAFGTAGVLMLGRAVVARDDGAMRHAAVLLGLAGVTKNEGVSLFVAAVVAMLAARAPRRCYVALWPAVVLMGSWAALRAGHDLPGDLASGSMLDRVSERLGALPRIADLLATWITTPVLWVVLLAGLAVAAPSRVRGQIVILLAVGVQFAFFVGAYLATPYEVEWHVMWSWSRISRQLAAPLVFAVMVALAQTFAPPHDVPHAEARPHV